MTRLVKAAAPAALAALVLAVPAPAGAQPLNALDRQRGLPAGLALPVPGVAVAETPAGLGTSPAAAGFVGALALEWFREGNVTESSNADGLYLASALGPLGLGYAVEWVRPGGEARRWRRNSLALATGDKRSFSIGFAWNRFTSPDPAIEPLASWDVGLTFRPGRHLSLGAAMLGRDARLGGGPVPVRYDLGVATRFWDDALTLSADLLADDRARDDFRATHLAFGAGAELRSGVGLGVQVLVPLREEAGLSRDPSAVVAVSWNGPHFGLTGGAAATPERTGGLGGVRVSAERWRSSGEGRTVPRIDIERELEPKRFLVFTIGDKDPYGLLLRRLQALRTDPEIAAVAVKIEGLPLGAGRIEELRGALAAIAERRPVLAYLTGGGTREYWLATAATAIAVPPGATVDVSGLAVSRLYLRDALARLGVAFEVVARGPFKSAPEPLVRDEGSPEAREMTDALLDDVFARFVADVAAARRLPPERVRALVDEALLSSDEARRAGLVDEVLWPDEVEGWARARTGRRVRLADGYRPDPERVAQRWGRPAIVEVIRVDGTLVPGRSRSAPAGRELLAGAETIATQLRRAAEDRQVKAIVLRVDSPGGDGLASDLVWREVVRARRKKPVVASMGDVAASGGYLVASAAEAIVAEPSTLTGSIGVFALKPDLSGLLEKLHVAREAHPRGQNAQLASVAKPWTPAERRAVERQVDVFYGLFLDRVAEGRKLAREEVERVAGGRVWTGRQALDRRLVDALGSLQDAVALARERAKLGPGAFVEVRRTGSGEGPFAALALDDGASAPAGLLAAALALPEVRALAALGEMGDVVALPVEWVLPGGVPRRP
jgi:protease-4